MKLDKLFLLSIVIFFSIACAKKESVKKEETVKVSKEINVDFEQKQEEYTTDKNKNEGVVKVKDTVKWAIFYGSKFKRMLYGKVKSSEELMYYIRRDASGNFRKTNDRYYKKGVAFPWNFEVEFDSLGRYKRETSFSFQTTKNNIQWVGTEHVYNKDNQLVRIKSLIYGRYDFYSDAGGMLVYNNQGKVKYRLSVWHEANDRNMWTRDSLVFKYNSRGDLENSKNYERHSKDEKLELEYDFGEPVIYTYDAKGRVIEKKEKDGNHETFKYKNGKLYICTRTLYERTDVYEYYPTGIIKSAKLRTTMSSGDYEFNKTGQPEFLDGQRIAEFKDYDKYGNWRTRISYKENGEPETYTNREIIYYE